MAELLEPYRLDLGRRDIDLGAVAVVLADTAVAAMNWYAFLQARKMRTVLKDRADAIRRFKKVVHELRRLRKDASETPVDSGMAAVLDAEIDTLLERAQFLLGMRIPSDQVTIKKSWPALAQFTTHTRPPEGMRAHREKKPWRKEADRALGDLGVPQDIRRELLTAIDDKASK